MNVHLGPELEKYAIGQPVSRSEDPRLLRGHGKYSDDVNLPGQAHGVFLRSPYAHGMIRSIDVKAARPAPGVLDVILAADLEAAGFGPLSQGGSYQNRDGSAMNEPKRPSLAKGKVRFVGEAVALVVAESRAEARDAVELIEWDVEPLPAATDELTAAAPGATQIHHEAPGNLGLDWEFGDAQAVDAAFAEAAHVTRLRLANNRVVVAAMEPRAAVAEYAAASGRYTFHAASQGPFGLKNGLSRKVLRQPPEKLRVLTYDVGGSFGMKSPPYPEYGPLFLAARRLGRPVKWCDERSESFLSDHHGRGGHVEAALAFDAEGRLLAARIEAMSQLGAYSASVGPNMQTGNYRKNFPGLYRLPLLHIRSRCYFTNTTPFGPYRGAGRPEANYYMERLMDRAAREMGVDRVELRRRNMIQPEEIPYDAVSGLTYDSGDFPAVLDKGLAAADWDGFARRRVESEARGKLRGIGLATYLEVTGPPGQELGRIDFLEDGSVSIISGTQNYGQGHASTFAQILVSRLGIPFDRIRLVQGDSDLLAVGGGTGGSKSVIAGGGAIAEAAERVIERGKLVAAQVLEAAVEDIAFEAGEFRIVGTDRAISVMALAERARGRNDLADDVPDGLDVEVIHQTSPSAFPNGCHVCEVEVDPDTGQVQVAGYTVVDDFGVMINPLLVEGQVHGGIAQGLGQALMEHAAYNAEGQPVAGSYMDYALPRAHDVPAFRFGAHSVPAMSNPLGAKGCGEAGCSGALPAVMNAVVDALSVRGVDHVDMPATPARVWAALKAAG